MRKWTRAIPAAFLALPLVLKSVGRAEGDAETNAKKIENLQKEVKELRRDLDTLRDVLRQIDQRTADMARRESRYYGPTDPNPNPNGGVGAAGRATITLQNDFAAPATIRINGIPYRVEAFQTREVQRVPVGPFNVDVSVEGFGEIMPVRTENLMPTGHRFRIFPR
jgi:hypothetical protein